MEAHVLPGSLAGSIPAVASKSMAHRLLILAACAQDPCEVRCNTTSLDIEATKRCLDTLHKTHASHVARLDCGESGSTLRFLLPIVGALGRDVYFVRHGRLAQRPLFPLDNQLEEHGMALTDQDDGTLLATGQLHGGRFFLPGDVSSQYISGLLMAAPLLDEPVTVLVTKPVQSRPYVELTISALRQFGVEVMCDSITAEGIEFESFCVQPSILVPTVAKGDIPFVTVEGDWSNAAFWLAAGAMEPQGMVVTGLNLQSIQGDRAVLAALSAFGARIARRGNAARATMDTPRAATLDVGAIPDLVPPLAAVAATTPGTSRLANAGRLRLKESDRLQTVSAAINALGGSARIDGDDLVVEGVSQLAGGTVDAANDHRIAMMAAIMATHASDPVTVCGAECVDKSYPTFWDDYASLGGNVTIR